MTATVDDRSLNGNHTFSYALRTRGGVCDCWSVPENSVTAGHEDPDSVGRSGVGADQAAGRAASRGEG